MMIQPKHLLLMIGLMLPMAAVIAETAADSTPAQAVPTPGSSGEAAKPAATSPAVTPAAASASQGRIRRLKAELKWVRAALKRQKEKTRQLEKQLSAQATKPIAVIDAEYSNKPVVLSAQTGKPVAAGKDHMLTHFVWLGISFAMLVVGFLSGVAWLRERYRKRLGGMHLRI